MMFWWGFGILIVAICAVFLAAPAWTRHPDLIPKYKEMMGKTGDMGDMSGMDMSDMQHGAAAEETPQEKVKHLADKRESEFNHHLAGFLVILAGGEIRVADVLFDCGRFPFDIQRHGNLAVRVHEFYLCNHAQS
jgi:hypothetical protein